MPLGHHRAAFERFHSENPQVYEHLKRLAFKLNARLLMELEPDLTGFFETRDTYPAPASRGKDEGGVE